MYLNGLKTFSICSILILILLFSCTNSVLAAADIKGPFAVNLGELMAADDKGTYYFTNGFIKNGTIGKYPCATGIVGNVKIDMANEIVWVSCNGSVYSLSQSSLQLLTTSYINCSVVDINQVTGDILLVCVGGSKGLQIVKKSTGQVKSIALTPNDPLNFAGYPAGSYFYASNGNLYCALNTTGNQVDITRYNYDLNTWTSTGNIFYGSGQVNIIEITPLSGTMLFYGRNDSNQNGFSGTFNPDNPIVTYTNISASGYTQKVFPIYEKGKFYGLISGSSYGSNFIDYCLYNNPSRVNWSYTYLEQFRFNDSSYSSANIVANGDVVVGQDYGLKNLWIKGSIAEELILPAMGEGIEEARLAAQGAQTAAQGAQTAAQGAQTTINTINNDILSVTAGIIRDSSGTVLQVARNTLTATNSANTILGTVKTDVGTVKSDVSSVRTAVGTVNTTVGAINTNVTAANTALGTVSSNVNTVKTDVSTVKTDVSSVKTTIGTVNTTVGTINTNVNTANTTLGTVNTNVTTVKNDVSSVKTTVGSVNTTLGTVNTNVGTVKTDVGTVKTDVGTVRTAVGNVNTTVSTINTNVTAANTTLGKVNTNVNTVKTDVGSIKTNVWDSTEGKSAATLAKEARDKINTVQSLMAPTISKVEGLNGATCTARTTFTVLIYASGANQYCARLAGGSWSTWDSNNSISVSVGSTSGAKVIEVKARNSANPSVESSSSIIIFKV